MELKMPNFSIIIPALNEEKFLPNLLASLTKQTKLDFEVIVVDGSSQDRTVDVARSYDQDLPFLSVLVSDIARVSHQRNMGAKAATGDWLIFIDADSTMLPYFIERVELFIEERRPEFFTTWMRPDTEGSGDAMISLTVNSVVESSIILHRSIAPGSLVLVKRGVFDRVGGFDEALSFGEDYDLTRRIGASGTPLQILRETLYVMSLRRIRRDGTFPILLLCTKVILKILITNRNFRHVQSYAMGGQPYGTKKKKSFRRKLLLHGRWQQMFKDKLKIVG